MPSFRVFSIPSQRQEQYSSIESEKSFSARHHKTACHVKPPFCESPDADMPLPSMVFWPPPEPPPPSADADRCAADRVNAPEETELAAATVNGNNENLRAAGNATPSAPGETSPFEMPYAESLLAGVTAMLVMAVAQRAIGMVRAILFCRWLDPDQLGLWDMAWGFITLMAPLAVLSLPGAFGRYAEHFAQRGALRPFIRRTAAFCVGSAAVFLAMIVVLKQPLAELVFGDLSYGGLMLFVAAALTTTISYNYLTSLLTALRQARRVALLDFLNSGMFALLGIVFLAAGASTAHAVVLAWSGACLVCLLPAGRWLAQTWRRLDEPAEPLGPGAVARKMAPLAAGIMVVNLLTNLFGLADRALIVHFAPGDALAVLGQYHSSRVLPLLLVSVAGLLAAIILPHLSHDWEAGRRNRAAARLSLVLKLSAWGLTAASAGLLFFGPFLFTGAWGQKFADGLAVLPWTLALCVWFGMVMLAQQYLWCAERTRWVCVALAVGLAINVGLNIFLLPRWGLHGAVWGTTIANGMTLLMILAMNCRLGFCCDRGLGLALLAPLMLPLGELPTLGMLVGLAACAAANCGLLSDEERAIIHERLRPQRSTDDAKRTDQSNGHNAVR